ncbi:MAG: undecaprenyldiphospho-muramoylpentapeptide beta-N-acetylglucosaminyltransferase [Hyphomicrobiales bacterium]
MPKVALLSAGGTGGHLFPAQALGNELISRGWEVHLATDTRASHFLAGFEGIEVHEIRSATPSVRSPVKALKAMFSLARGTFGSRRIIQRIRPSVFVGFGGYPSTPPGVAAALSKVPIVLHEANATPGRANRFLARFASAYARSLPGPAFGKNAIDVETGNPVRQAVLDVKRPYTPLTTSDKLNLLVFGGSQGAQVFSQLLPDALTLMDPQERARIALTLQVRSDDRAVCEKQLNELNVFADLAPFFADLPERIANAHFIIGRAGASTVSELAVLGRPALLVPYPHALDHDQAANADVLAKAGSATVVVQAELTPEVLAARLSELLNNPDQLSSMADAAAAIGRPEATQHLADLVVKIAKP